VHDTAANACTDAGLEKRLRDLSDVRRNTARGLGDVLASVGDGPLWPEPERELLSKAATWLRSTLSADADLAVTTDCRNAELAVRDAAAAALQRSLTAPLRERIQKVRQEAEAKISELDRVLGGRQGDPG
jgi:hypothetical protein